MTALLRLLIALAIATLIALPIVGSDGGENGGGTGIWILPRATFVGGLTAVTPVENKSFNTLANDLVMQVSSECGACSASFVDEVTGVPVALPVVGNRVRLPAPLLQALAVSGAKANIVVMDAAGYGYLLSVTASATGVSVNLY